MREIKFRGIGVNSNEWFYGSYVNGGNTTSGVADHTISEYGCYATEVAFSTVGQYTSILDMHCNGLYEGDILSGFSGDVIGVIEWSDDECMYWIKTKNGGGMLTQDYAENFKVIGNIHQNPELIK